MPPTRDVLLVNDDPQLSWRKLFFLILPVARCPRTEIVKWKVVLKVTGDSFIIHKLEQY